MAIRQAPQLLVKERRLAVERVRIPVLPFMQEIRDLTRIGGHRK
jgi:hypothetical protein